MKRSKFSLSHFRLMSLDMGELVPMSCFEVLPGDTIQMQTNALVRCSPLVTPVMHPVSVRMHHWYVPYRLIWDDFEDFITGGPDGMDDSEYPTITLATNTVGSLADYLGVPLMASPLSVSALPFRAYAAIFNEWYRDQDLVSVLALDKTSGVDSTTNTTLQNIAWEKDYFTSSRPWEQKGPSITIPIGDEAPVSLSGPVPYPTLVAYGNVGGATQNNQTAFTTNASGEVRTSPSGLTVQLDPQGALKADLSGASAITVTALREALALQRYEEARARFGSRYTEYLRYLGVMSSDARLQRPEYLGGGKNTIQFSEVLQTAEGEDPVGEMRGHGINGTRSNRFRKFIEEHGVVLSLMSVRPKTIYMQGLNRMWNRRTKEDFWQQELQFVGQQEVLFKELYAPHATPEATFGWQDRYDEYRRIESGVAGEFRTSTLNSWHMARDFSSDPALNATFVKCVPTERTFAAPSEDVIYAYCRHSVQARRLVARTGKSFIY